MNLRICIPRVRHRGHGLGNELIPWTRAFLAAQILGAHALPPAFGLNRRRYWRHFGTPRWDWIRNRALASVLPVVRFTYEHYLAHGGGDVAEALRGFARAEGLFDRRCYVLLTEGMWGGYEHIRAGREFVRATLYGSRFAARNLTRLEMRIDRTKALVAMHVRLGDFKAAKTLEEYRGRFNLALPLAWYQNAALCVQRQLGDAVQFLVVSDGPIEALRPLTDSLPCISTADVADSDCSDLLALASADLLICSVSSYSQWAAYLSDAPYLWFAPGLQTHADGFLSVWGAEGSQAQLHPTARALRHFSATPGPAQPRGVPVGMDGAVPAWVSEQIRARLAWRRYEGDLIRAGVVRQAPAAAP